MAKQELVALSDLKRRFSEFDKVAEVTGDLKKTFERINKENVDAGGTDDEIARTYHEKTKEPTEGLVELVGGIQKLLELTGDNGTVVADGFGKADSDASDHAHNW